MKIVRERKAQCPAFAHVILREDIAATRLPEDGIPDHVHCCAQHVEGSDKAPVRLSGPASRAPEISKGDEMGEESEESDDATPSTLPPLSLKIISVTIQGSLRWRWILCTMWRL